VSGRVVRLAVLSRLARLGIAAPHVGATACSVPDIRADTVSWQVGQFA
jgi:hypothetical protein